MDPLNIHVAQYVSSSRPRDSTRRVVYIKIPCMILRPFALLGYSWSVVIYFIFELCLFIWHMGHQIIVILWSDAALNFEAGEILELSNKPVNSYFHWYIGEDLWWRGCFILIRLYMCCLNNVGSIRQDPVVVAEIQLIRMLLYPSRGPTKKLARTWPSLPAWWWTKHMRLQQGHRVSLRIPASWRRGGYRGVTCSVLQHQLPPACSS